MGSLPKNKYKAIAIAMAFLFLASTGSAQDQNTEPVGSLHAVYFSLADKFDVPGKEPQQIFDCSDKIFTVLELVDFPKGQHQISVRWFDPVDSAREHTQYAFNVREKNTRLWAWLSLSRATGAGMLQFINPSAGLDEFIGIWKVEVRVNNTLLDSQNFEVSC